MQFSFTEYLQVSEEKACKGKSSSKLPPGLDYYVHKIGWPFVIQEELVLSNFDQSKSRYLPRNHHKSLAVNQTFTKWMWMNCFPAVSEFGITADQIRLAFAGT